MGSRSHVPKLRMRVRSSSSAPAHRPRAVHGWHACARLPADEGAHGASRWTYGDRFGSCAGTLGLVPHIQDLEPLVGRWRQVIDAPRHVEGKVEGDLTLEWLGRREGNPPALDRRERDVPEGVVLIMAADEDAEGDFTAHYFDSRAVSRVLHMTFQDGVWKWSRHASGPDDFDQRFEGTLSEDGKTIQSSCYLVEAGEWILDFDVRYTRA